MTKEKMALNIWLEASYILTWSVGPLFFDHRQFIFYRFSVASYLQVENLIVLKHINNRKFV